MGLNQLFCEQCYTHPLSLTHTHI